MSAKHTPGPWHYWQRDIGGFRIEVSEDDPPLALVPTNGRPPVEVEANARLIAAAPKMLEALTVIRDWRDCRDKLAGEHAAHLLDVIDAITDLAASAVESAS